MKKITGRFIALALSCVTMLTSVGVVPVYADTNRVVTLGEDLTDEQELRVLQFFGVSETDNIEYIYVNNKEEHEYLDGILPSSVIGSRTYSCAYIEPTMSGGINIKTANLTYVTHASLYAALQTAGIENCNVIVTAPFEVSGTGALTGIFKAYDNLGIELEEEKQELASEELILNAELEQEYGEGVTDLVTEVKGVVTQSEETMSNEEIKEVIEEKVQTYNINISIEHLDELVGLISKLQDLDYDENAFHSKLDEIQGAVEEATEKAGGFIESVKEFFKSIIDFFKNLFSPKDDVNNIESTENIEVESSESSTPSIFDDVDTSIFQFDDEKTADASSSEESLEGTADVEGTENTESTEDIEGTESDDLIESDSADSTEDTGSSDEVESSSEVESSESSSGVVDTSAESTEVSVEKNDISVSK